MGFLRVWAEMGVWMRRGSIASALLLTGAAVNGVGTAEYNSRASVLQNP